MAIAKSDNISIPKGTYGIDINFTVYNNDGTAYNLTGLTVKLHVWKAGIPGTLIVDGSCTLVVAASGTCKYTVASGDFDTVGVYLWELEMTKASFEDNTETGRLTVTESS